MKQPLISIVTPVFNGGKTIERTILHVIEQHYNNWEYIIIDGFSTDGTRDIIAKCASRDNRIKFISEKDNGIYDAMNKGLRMCKGEIIGIINCDDWYELDAFKTIANYYLENGDGVFYGIQRRLYNNMEFSLERLNHNFLNKGMIPHSSTFISNKIYRENGLFDTQYKIVADYDLMIKFKNVGVSFYPISLIISNFSIGGASSTYKASLESLKLKLTNKFISPLYYYMMKFKIIIFNKYLGR